MPAVNKTEIFEAPIENIFKVIKDFEAYPDFVDGVSKVTILEETKTTIKAKYSLNMIKSFEYIVNVKLKSPTEVSWTLDSGDLFKKNNGSWTLKKIDDHKTEVTYGLDVDFKVFAPKMIVNKLVKTSLPQMMKSFHKKAKEL